jgi:carbamoyl-phosphate synthase large subunit
MKYNILFTCAGRRNYLINYFKKALNGNGIVIATDSLLSAPALIDADVAYKVADIYDSDYIYQLKKIVTTHNVKAIISLNDLELPILSKHKTDLESLHTRVIVSNENVIDISYDKWKTYQFLKEKKLNTPETFKSLNEALTAIDKGLLKFPVVLKPRWGSGSKGISYPETLEELKLAYKLLKIKLERTCQNAENKTPENAILIQEKLVGKEYGLDVVNNFNNEYFATFTKEKLYMRAGETDKAKSVIHEDFNILGEKIATHLKHIGSIDVDVILQNNKLYVIEINPRFGGGYPFSHEAGADIASVYIDWLKGCSNQDVMKHINYVENVTFSKCDTLLKVFDKNNIH